jgi:hypothetical protein
MKCDTLGNPASVRDAVGQLGVGDARIGTTMNYKDSGPHPTL